MTRRDGIYRELCFTCHGADGKGAPMAGRARRHRRWRRRWPARRASSAHRDYIIKVLLHGLTGPVDGKNYPGGVMVPMGSNTDEWIADVATYVRNSFGNRAMFVTPAAGRGGAESQHAQDAVDRWPSSRPPSPALLTNTSEWKLTASHNAEAAANVVTAGAGALGHGAAAAARDVVPDRAAGGDQCC